MPEKSGYKCPLARVSGLTVILVAGSRVFSIASAVSYEVELLSRAGQITSICISFKTKVNHHHQNLLGY